MQEIELSIEQRQRLEAAFLNAFNGDDLSQMLRLKLGIKIGDELNVARGLKYVVTDLIDLAISAGWLAQLLLAAKDYRPGNLRLQAVLGELNVVQPEKIAKENVVVDDGAASSRLEKIVRKRMPLMPFVDYMDRLSAIGHQIARVEMPQGKEAGTGWLVGSNLLLTAYHVIEGIVQNSKGLTYKDLFFRFDYAALNAASRVCSVQANWLTDHSPYSASDLAASNTDPSPTELDYALVELSEHAGNDDLPDGKKRGWIKVPEHPVAMSTDDFVMIPQHPDGRPLEIAFGELLKYNNSANRVRYDTNTEPGSSGSPCFDMSAQPFALHHASGPGDNLPYNQGLPLREIIRLMKSKNITPFWVKND